MKLNKHTSVGKKITREIFQHRFETKRRRRRSSSRHRRRNDKKLIKLEHFDAERNQRNGFIEHYKINKTVRIIHCAELICCAWVCVSECANVLFASVLPHIIVDNCLIKCIIIVYIYSLYLYYASHRLCCATFSISFIIRTCVRACVTSSEMVSQFILFLVICLAYLHHKVYLSSSLSPSHIGVKGDKKLC